MFGGVFVTLGSHGVDQMMVQRYLCARDLRDGRRALTLGGYVIVAQFALFLLIGVGLFAFYQLNPPAVPFDRPDRVFARFILDEMPVGVVGVLLGAIFAAAMSTLSGSLNSCATAATRDLYLPLSRRTPTPERELGVTRWLTAVFGVLQIGVGIGGHVAAVVGGGERARHRRVHHRDRPRRLLPRHLRAPRRRAGGARRPGRRARRDDRDLLRHAARLAVVRARRLGAHLRDRLDRQPRLAPPGETVEAAFQPRR